MPSSSGGGRCADRAPDVERALGRRDRRRRRGRAGRRAARRASRGTSAGSRRVSASTCVGVEQRDRRALQRLASRRRRGTSPRWRRASITFFGPDRPRHAPARVAPVLGQAVEDHDRIAVDVLDVARRALDRPLRAESAARRSASRTRRGAACSRARARRRPSSASSSPRDELAGRVARVATAGCADRPRPRISRRRSSARERVAALALEQDRDRREQPEDVEQLLVRGVVGQEVAEVDVAERRGARASARRARRPRSRRSRRVYCDGMPRRNSSVVEAGDRLAQLPQAGDRRVLLVVDGDAERRRCAAARRAAGRSRAGPGRGCTTRDRRCGKPRRCGLGGDVDDARARHGSKSRNSVVGHRAKRGF